MAAGRNEKWGWEGQIQFQYIFEFHFIFRMAFSLSRSSKIQFNCSFWLHFFRRLAFISYRAGNRARKTTKHWNTRIKQLTKANSVANMTAFFT